MLRPCPAVPWSPCSPPWSSPSLGAALAGCGGDDAETLTIYSGRQETLVGPLLERFADEKGVDIDVKYGDSADLAVLVDTEGDNSPGRRLPVAEPGRDRLPRR